MKDVWRHYSFFHHSARLTPWSRPNIGLYRENAIAIESEAKYQFGSNVNYATMQITLPISEFERHLHGDVAVADPGFS